MPDIALVELYNQKQYRIIPSTFPPINFFEDLVDNASEMETLLEIESLTNDRLRQEVGDIFLVPVEDRVVGQGSSVVMAAFTHIYIPSRFSDGSYGVYYAGLTLETAIRETVFHREKFLRATTEEPGEITMRVYGGNCIAAFRPPAISIPQQISHLRYYWDGEKISTVFDAKIVMHFD